MKNKSNRRKLKIFYQNGGVSFPDVPMNNPTEIVHEDEGKTIDDLKQVPFNRIWEGLNVNYATISISNPLSGIQREWFFNPRLGWMTEEEWQWKKKAEFFPGIFRAVVVFDEEGKAFREMNGAKKVEPDFYSREYTKNLTGLEKEYFGLKTLVNQVFSLGEYQAQLVESVNIYDNRIKRKVAWMEFDGIQSWQVYAGAQHVQNLLDSFEPKILNDTDADVDEDDFEAFPDFEMPKFTEVEFVDNNRDKQPESAPLPKRKKSKKKFAKNWKAGAPENGGHSESKLVIRYGEGTKPPQHSRKIEKPYFSFDWKNRYVEKKDPELGIRKLKLIVTKHIQKGFDVRYACIYESSFKGRPLQHFTPTGGWVDDNQWQRRKENQAGNSTLPLYRAWVCLNPSGQYFREQAGEKYANPVFWSKESGDLADGDIRKRMAVQSILNQIHGLGDWQQYIQNIYLYDNTKGRDGQRLGRIEFSVGGKWVVVATDEAFGAVIEDREAMAAEAIEFDGVLQEMGD